MTDTDRVTALALAAGRGDRVALEAFIRATERDVSNPGGEGCSM
jgi:RNA polymerase sigma-70 factor (ECF subfamily)